MKTRKIYAIENTRFYKDGRSIDYSDFYSSRKKAEEALNDCRSIWATELKYDYGTQLHFRPKADEADTVDFIVRKVVEHEMR